MSKNREKKHAAHLTERHAHAQEVVESAAAPHEQHLVEVPKGTSRARFMFNLLLVIFLLLIFSITGPMMAALTGGGAASGAAYMSWTGPDDKVHSLDYSEFITEKQRFRHLEVFLPYLLLGQVDPGDDIQLARFLILEQLAQRAGIYVADGEVSATILEQFGSEEVYDNWLSRGRDLTKRAFEKVFRRGLVVRRFIQMSAVPAGEVLPEKVIERWKLGAKEYNFEFVEALAADYEEAARAEVPADPELEEWFNALPEPQKRAFHTERSLALDVAWFDPRSEETPDSLFARYPRPEDEDAEERAKDYFNGNSHIRFARPEPTPGADEAQGADEESKTEEEQSPGEEQPAVEQPAVEQPAVEEPKTDEELKAEAEQEVEDERTDAEKAFQELFFTFDEVAEQVRREAPVFRSMGAWVADMQARKRAGEAVDLETEAISMGLAFQRVEPRTLTALRESPEPWAGRYLAGSVSRLQEGELSRRVEVEQQALIVVRVGEILQPTLPPFAEIRDRVADKWVEQRKPEIAAEKLEALRATLGEPTDEDESTVSATSDEFRAAAQAAGFEVQERGWQSKVPRPGAPEERATQAEFYLRSRTSLFGLDEGSVPPAEASRDGKAAYLVRTAGEREADQSTMRPVEADQIQTQLRTAALTGFFQKTFGNDDWLRSKFNLVIGNEDEEEPAE
jgi:hypothetical protein